MDAASELICRCIFKQFFSTQAARTAEQTLHERGTFFGLSEEAAAFFVQSLTGVSVQTNARLNQPTFDFSGASDATSIVGQVRFRNDRQATTFKDITNFVFKSLTDVPNVLVRPQTTYIFLSRAFKRSDMVYMDAFRSEKRVLLFKFVESGHDVFAVPLDSYTCHAMRAMVLSSNDPTLRMVVGGIRAFFEDVTWEPSTVSSSAPQRSRSQLSGLQKRVFERCAQLSDEQEGGAFEKKKIRESDDLREALALCHGSVDKALRDRGIIEYADDGKKLYRITEKGKRLRV